jgi:hypothetical protein
MKTNVYASVRLAMVMAENGMPISRTTQSLARIAQVRVQSVATATRMFLPVMVKMFVGSRMATSFLNTHLKKMKNRN